MTVPAAPSSAAGLRELGREHPEWQAYLVLLGEVWREAEHPGWRDAAGAPPDPDGSSPLLARATIRIDERLARRWCRRLIGAAGMSGARVSDVDVMTLIDAGIRGAEARLDLLPRALDVDPGRLRSISCLLAAPLVLACGRAWASHPESSWCEPYCPTCGGWPTLSEARGLGRERRLRCARDGADWSDEWLRCVYCGNRDHAALGALVIEDPLDTRRAETCLRCRGYLKTVGTLSRASVAELALLDLRTVELDVTALAEGYRRPDPPEIDWRTEVTAIEPSGRWWR